MSEVVRKESIVCQDDYLASNPSTDDNRRVAHWPSARYYVLVDCIQKSEQISMEYCASSLHRRCIDWKLNGSRVQDHREEEEHVRIFPGCYPEVFTQTLETREIGPKARILLHIF
jgi:hypothetical protein